MPTIQYHRLNMREKIAEKNQQLNVNVVGKFFQVRKALKKMRKKILLQIRLWKALTEDVTELTHFYSQDICF